MKPFLLGVIGGLLANYLFIISQTLFAKFFSKDKKPSRITNMELTRIAFYAFSLTGIIFIFWGMHFISMGDLPHIQRIGYIINTFSGLCIGESFIQFERIFKNATNEKTNKKTKNKA